MKKAFLVLGMTLAAFIFGSNAWSQENNIDLDKSFVQENQSSSYKEWTGGYAPQEINTTNQIMDIGRRLGKGIKYQEQVNGDPAPFNKGNPAYKYSAARVYSQTKRGADILLIGSTATVDTIKCLKMIIRGYLEETFGYSRQDAIDAAENICYWNTNRFGDTDYFARNFEPAVLSVFEGRYTKAGLSSDYRDWKESIIVIPHIFNGTIVEEAAVPEVDVEEMTQSYYEAEEEVQVEPTEASEPEEPAVEETFSAPVSAPVAATEQGFFTPKNIIILAAALLLVIAVVAVVVTRLRNRNQY